MRRIKLLGMALLAVFSFGVVIAATAQAEEKEPPGYLFLPGEKEGANTEKGEAAAEVTFKTLGLLKDTITCTKVRSTAALAGTGSHLDLGTQEFDFEGCKLGKVGCSSENIVGAKDPKEVVLLVKEDTDLHLVSLLDGSKLLAGRLIGLLELVSGEKKLDLTMNCGGVKVLVLGATFFDVLKASPIEDVKEIEITPTLLTCDKADTLCKAELEKWDAKGAVFNEATKKDEIVLCPLAMFIQTEEECVELTFSKPLLGVLTPMVLIDF
jgi:hypothetical protein